MKILITGSSGQIGTNLGLKCLGNGHQVKGLDCRENTWTNAIDTTIHNLAQPCGNLTSLIPFNPDIVVHLAAHAKVHELVESPAKALENINMTAHILEYCRLNNTPVAFSSSREVYGNIPGETIKETDADFANTCSPYTASKTASEALIYSYSRCYGLKYVVFRLSNVYGRYDHDLHRMERVIPLFVGNIQNDLPLSIYGVNKVLDFTYIDDCIEGLYSGLEALKDGRIGNQTINLAYGRGHTLSKLAEYIGQILCKEPKIDLSESLTGEMIHYVANIEKAAYLLGYQPKTDLRDGLQKAIAHQIMYTGLLNAH